MSAAVGALAAGVSGVVASHLLRGPLARPAAAGSSADRCAQCGSTEHSMLSGACPAAPQVLR